MPNRIIKESIWTSPNLARLSPRAELHFYRLLPLPDDFGCFESTPGVVRGRCYPLNEGIRSTDIQKWQDELEVNGLILRWNDNGREYGIFPTWQKHQRVRSTHLRKTPEPPAEIMSRCYMEAVDDFGQNVPSIDSERRQAPSNDGLNPNHNHNHNPEHNHKPEEKENIKEKKYEVKAGVLLTSEETSKLIEQFGEAGANQRIEKLSLYLLSTGKKYKSHYYTLLNWERMAKPGNGHTTKIPGNGSSDPDKFLKGKYAHMVQR